MRHLGVLAHSVPGAAACFRTFCELGMRRLGSFQHPDVTMDCIPMGRSMNAWHSGRYGSIRSILAGSVERLARTGAEFFVCPDNTAHLALELPGADLPLPGLHIADVVARRAAAAGYREVAILGTKWTMDSDLYPRAMARHGLATQVPSPADQDAIQAITFDQLVHGVFTETSRRQFVDVIASLRDGGCDAVALVCTEFPLLVTAEVSPLPTLDSTTLLTEAALDVAVEQGALPTWRGGPGW
jgi:aspartate racemase